MPSASRIDAFSGSRRFAFSSATVACAARPFVEQRLSLLEEFVGVGHRLRYGKFSRIRSSGCVKSRVPGTTTPRTSTPASSARPNTSASSYGGPGQVVQEPDELGADSPERDARQLVRTSGAPGRCAGRGRASPPLRGCPRRAAIAPGASPHSARNARDRAGREHRVGGGDEHGRRRAGREGAANRVGRPVGARLAHVRDVDAERRAVAEERLDVLRRGARSRR